ncbi:putative lipase atg15 [Nowakowskiella sp. JEL0407]|nr:putative lipase atg15 [Nowakowskiella sp. JEL0407]
MSPSAMHSTLKGSTYSDWSVRGFKSAQKFKSLVKVQNGRNGGFGDEQDLEVGTWKTKSAVLPDETDPKTVLSIANMTCKIRLAGDEINTYYDPAKKKTNWFDMGGKWNESVGFGWESDGIRGYVFADERNEIMVITVKGTSAAFFGVGDVPTSARDKFNDNMMFSCCCAKPGWTWKGICGCCTSPNRCDKNCLLDESSYETSYYNLAQTIFIAVAAMFPQASIWMAGHSLGGSLASLIGLTNGVPAFCYETPGDLMYASRIGLLPELPPIGTKSNKFPKILGNESADYSDYLEMLPIFHFGHTADPIFLGVCNGAGSSCWYGGFSMDSKCHAGKVCVYDAEASRNRQGGGRTVDYKNRNDIAVRQGTDMRTHGIEWVIKNILTKIDYVPECKVEQECSECDDWEFYET